MMFAWKHPRLLLEQVAGWGVAGALLYWWLGVAESSLSQLLLSAAAVFAMIAVIAFLAGRIRNTAAATSAARPALVAALVTFAASLAVAWWLVWWIPSVQGLRMQALSAGVRFGAAYLLVVTFWVDLIASGGKAPRAPQPSTAPSPN